MKIRMYVRDTSTGALAEDRELPVGLYSEFYLPALRPNHDVWIVILADEDGPATEIHLKR
jgi:hypothetical protein